MEVLHFLNQIPSIIVLFSVLTKMEFFKVTLLLLHVLALRRSKKQKEVCNLLRFLLKNEKPLTHWNTAQECSMKFLRLTEFLIRIFDVIKTLYMTKIPFQFFSDPFAPFLFVIILVYAVRTSITITPSG